MLLVHIIRTFTLSLSARRAWIEIEVENGFAGVLLSLSARRAWIEIWAWGRPAPGAEVALRKESVDRNNFGCLHYNITVMVALRKESVDRNPRRQQAFNAIDVALRKESVDRNC